MSLFNIIGPVMVGPSSSHTSGAVRIGNMVRTLLKDEPVEGDILLHGSFASTGKGHGTDKGIVAGILGMDTDDIRIPDSFEIAEKKGFKYNIHTGQINGAHPNTALIKLSGASGRCISVQASSVGGGSIMVNKIDDIDVNFSGENPTLIVHNPDQPGHVAEVTSMLSHKKVNIAKMQLYRENRGEYAVMVIETDQSVPEEGLKWLENVEGVLKITYYDGERSHKGD